MHRFRRAVPLILSVVLLACAGGPVRSARAAGATLAFSDMRGHWSASMVAQATADGYVNGYPDGTFRPDAQVTRAEMVKLTVVAGQLPRVDWRAPTGFRDGPHWVGSYLAQAEGYGIVDPADYGGMLRPDLPASRLVATVMALKLLGRQGGVPQGVSAADVKVADSGSLPEWARGWVMQALADGIVTGYPDGTFRAEGAITRAEAVAMVQRTMRVMTAGVDPSLQLQVGVYKAATPPVPLAIRNGLVYAPAQSVYGLMYAMPDEGPTGMQLQTDNEWFQYQWPVLAFPTGAAYALARTSDRQQELDQKPLVAPTYRLYGRLMVPVAPAGGTGSVPYLTVTHDAAAGVVRVTPQPDWPANALPATPEDAAKLCGIADTVMAPGQADSLFHERWCDALGNQLRLTVATPFGVRVDPMSPLRLRERPDGPLMTELHLAFPVGRDMAPEVVVLPDAAGGSARGKFTVTFTREFGTGSRGSFTRTIAVADPHP
ncbi:MAG: S-layer domain protein [Firmicutes bacterium]|nr:S-layer domain protein [Bacillota bacterium]